MKKWVSKNTLVYFVMILILFSILISFYFFVVMTVSKEVEKTNNNMLSIIKLSMDTYVKDVEEIQDDLSCDTNILRIMNGYQIVETDIKNVQHKLGNICAEKFFISDAYVLFGNRDFIISGKGISDIKDYFVKEKGASDEEYFRLRQTLGKKFKSEFLSSSNAVSNNNALMAVCSIPVDNIGILKAQIVVEVDVNKIIKSMSFKEKYNIFIRDKDRLIVYSDKNNEIEDIIYTVSKNGIYGDNEKYNISLMESDNIDLSYLVGIKCDDYMRPVTYLRYVMIFVLLICIIFITALLMKLSNMHRKKIIKVLDLLGKDSDTKPSYEELYIRVENMIADRERVDARILSKLYIKELLTGMDGTHVQSEKYLNDSREHIVILVAIENYEHIYNNVNYGLTTLEKFQEAQMITENILMESLSDGFYLLSAEVYDEMALVLESKIISEYVVEKVLKDVEEKIKKFFFFSLRYGIARVEDNNYAKAYQEVYNSLHEMGDDYFDGLIPGESETEESLCYYPNESEQKIIAYIKHNQYEDAKAEIKRIIDKNYEGKIAVPKLHSLHNLLLNTMVRVIAELDMSRHKELYMKLSKLMKVKKAHEFFDGIDSFIDDIESLCIKESDVDIVFKKKISGYIEKKYNDINISLNMLADYMQMNPSYLSRKFKKQFGIGVLEYIYITRIEMAKKHLEDGKSVEKVSEEVGFTTKKTFIRTFVKYVGVTPTQYKK